METERVVQGGKAVTMDHRKHLIQGHHAEGGDGSVGKMLAWQAQVSQFDTQHKYLSLIPRTWIKKSGTEVCTCPDLCSSLARQPSFMGEFQIQ